MKYRYTLLMLATLCLASCAVKELEPDIISNDVQVPIALSSHIDQELAA